MRMSPLAALFPLFTLSSFACKEEVEDTGSGTLDPADNGDTDCSGTPPEITKFTVEDGGPITGEGGGDEQPSVLLLVDFEDADGDAHVVHMDIWYDDVVDGTVDVTGPAETGTTDSALKDSDGNVVDECAGKDASLGIKLGVTGGDLAYSTQYDWAVVVYDNADMGSEPAFTTAPTPDPL